jgi:beta-hydroxyacyl-ACP dehydratase FabZ
MNSISSPALSAYPFPTCFAIIDGNNFFVSCERVFDPSLTNKPVIVLSNNDGCAISRSNEVKALGIPMGAPLHTFSHLIKQHDIQIFSSNFELYGDLSNRMMKILQTFTPDIEIYSIDEAFLNLAPLPCDKYETLAQCVYYTVLKEIGIPITVGIGPTKTLAKVANRIAKKQKDAAPVFDIFKKPLYDINDITKMLPHRYPFLLIDKILEMDASSIVGIKNVTMNEPFFQGHFPGNPVMPGVLQVEAMAQVGGIFALSQVTDPENYSTYFMKIDGVKFKLKVLPGDTIIFKLTLESPIRRGLVNMRGVAYVNGKEACEALMLAQVVRDRVPKEETQESHA